MRRCYETEHKPVSHIKFAQRLKGLGVQRSELREAVFYNLRIKEVVVNQAENADVEMDFLPGSMW